MKGNTYYRNGFKFNLNHPDNYGYASHAKNFSKYFERSSAKKHDWLNEDEIILVEKFYGLNEKPKKIFFINEINYKKIEDFINDSENFEKKSNFKFDINLKKYNGSELFLTVKTEKEGWLSFIDNWDEDWKAYVNNKPVKIFKLFNSYKSIKIKNGKSKIVFKYVPWSANNGLSVFSKLYKND